MTTMLEILDETIAAYTSKTRAAICTKDAFGLEVYGCEYLTPDGRMCAVGRCMIDPCAYSGDMNCSVTEIEEKEEGGLDSLLKPEYKGFRIGFWRSLQNLHDTRRFWTDEGLSGEGREHVGRIRATFNLGDAHDNDA